MEDKIISEKEVAAMIKMSVQTLRNHRSRRTGIPYLKMTPGQRGAVRYLLADVTGYVARHRIETENK